ncbi:MAG: extracellular solute-binding protein [Chloroflexota bacterium]
MAIDDVLSRRLLLRRAGLMAAGAAALPLFAACGAGATTTATSGAVSSAATATAAVAAAPTTAATSSAATASAGTGPNATATAQAAIPKVAPGAFLFSTYGSDAEGKVWDQAIAAFSKVHPDIKVQHDTPADFYNKVLVEAAAGTPSDGMMFETKRMPNYITQAFFLPLDKYVATSKVTNEKDFFPFSWRKAQLNGKLYGIAWDEAPAVLFYSVDSFQKNGVDLPPKTWGTPDWNWQKFIDVCQKLTSKAGASPSFAIRQSNWWIYSLPWIWSNGGDILNADFTKSNITATSAVEGFQYGYDLRWKYQVNPTPADQKQKQEEDFNHGLLAMIPTNAAFGVVARTQFTSVKWDVAPYPTGSAGAFTRSPADAVTIAAESKVPDKVWAFNEWVTSVDGLTIMMQQGRVPTRTEVAYGVYLKQQPAINWQLMADASKDHQKNQPVTDKFQETDKLLSDNWGGPVFDKNTVTPQQFTQKVDGPLNDLMHQATFRRVIKA